MTLKQSSFVRNVISDPPISGNLAKKTNASIVSLDGITTKVSLLYPGLRAVVPADSYMLLVCVAGAQSSSIVVALPDGSTVIGPEAAGDCCVLSSASVVTFRNESSIEIVRFDIPKHSLHAFGWRIHLQRTGTLSVPKFGPDRLLLTLSRTIQPLLEQKNGCTTDFAEFFSILLYSHLLEAYGGASASVERFIGGLSPHHKRVVEVAFGSCCAEEMSIQALAKQCDLSRRHFARAFRQTFGVPFHQHLVNARIVRAKDLLLGTTFSLRDIATSVGYADQATFTEGFTRAVGSPPGRYRRRFSLEARTSAED